MPRVFAVHVASAKAGQRNLRAGLNSLVWGWRDSVLDKRNHREVAKKIQPGDLLVIGTHGPNPRVPVGAWAEARMGRVLVLRFTSALYQAQTALWPDEVEAADVLYPNRADFEVVYDAQAPETIDLEPAVLEALRLSANTQGRPVLTDVADVVLPIFDEALAVRPTFDH